MKTRPATLRISPTAWAKLLYLRDAGDTEIGGFAISSHDDLLFVEDVELVVQQCTWSNVAFDDESVAEYFDRQVEAGRRPEEFARIWVHTHPGRSPEPSSTDEATLTRVFGRADWAVMLIVARGGETYARLRYNIGPGADIVLPVEVDYSRPFRGTDHAAWQAEFTTCVQREPVAEPPALRALHSFESGSADECWRDAWDEYVDFESLTLKEHFDYAGDI